MAKADSRLYQIAIRDISAGQYVKEVYTEAISPEAAKKKVYRSLAKRNAKVKFEIMTLSDIGVLLK